MDHLLILDNIRSVHNTGSLFRTAETLGIQKIYCVGTTPTPLDRFGKPRPDFAKVALGSENMVSSEYAEDGKALIAELKKEGYNIVALEQAENSIDYKDVKINSKTAFILGNEVEGVSPEILKLAHTIAHIVMKGDKESLNVSVAGGIALFRWLDL